MKKVVEDHEHMTRWDESRGAKVCIVCGRVVESGD